MSQQPQNNCSLSAGKMPFSPSERAVSYVVGFLLVFSIAVLSTVGVVVFGFDVLAGADQDQATAVAKENMNTLGADLEDLTTQRSASSEQRLQIANAQLGVRESSTLRITATGNTFDFTGSDALEWQTQHLVYRLPDYETEFVYAFGHVFQRHDDPDSQALTQRPPLIEYGSSQIFIVVPSLELQSSSPDQISADELTEREIRVDKPRPVSSSSQSIERTNRQPNGDPTNMTGTIAIEGTTDPNAWIETFEDQGLQNVQSVSLGSGEYRVEGTFESEQLVVQQADLEVQLSP